jgi:hypothetical protein
MPDERPVERPCLRSVASMTLAEVQAELRALTGTPWSSTADGPRQQALWRRLDQLVAREEASASEGEGNTFTGESAFTKSNLLPSPAASGPPDLQALITRFGNYSNIPSGAWAEHDHTTTLWREARGMCTGKPAEKKTP